METEYDLLLGSHKTCFFSYDHRARKTVLVIAIERDLSLKQTITISTPATPGGSFYLPPSNDSSSSEEISFDSAPATTKREPKSKTTDPFNDYLRTREISPIRSRLQRPWEEASERTRRYFVRKAGQGLPTLLQDIAPSDSGSLFKPVYSSGVIQRTLQCNGEEATSSSVDKTVMSALAECYRAADNWETRRQILSIMAIKSTLNQLRHWIPDLSQYRFTEARRHCLEGGRGAPVLTAPTPRMRVSTAQMDHSPFGERTIMLSTKETIKVPNVLRMIIPERTVIQYKTYCQESGFTPLSHATLLRILSKCAASVRTSVQGLDYVSAAGAEAFDDLCDVVETLGDVGQGIGWAKQQENNLCASKRYLKSDFKVGVTRVKQNVRADFT